MGSTLSSSELTPGIILCMSDVVHANVSTFSRRKFISSVLSGSGRSVPTPTHFSGWASSIFLREGCYAFLVGLETARPFSVVAIGGNF